MGIRVSLEQWHQIMDDVTKDFDPTIIEIKQDFVLFRIGDYMFESKWWPDGLFHVYYWMPNLFIDKRRIQTWQGFKSRLQLAYNDREKGDTFKDREGNKKRVRNEESPGHGFFKKYVERIKSG